MKPRDNKGTERDNQALAERPHSVEIISHWEFSLIH